MARFNFIELPASDVGATKSFYSSVFGWELTDFGPSYSCTMTGDVDLGSGFRAMLPKRRALHSPSSLSMISTKR